LTGEERNTLELFKKESDCANRVHEYSMKRL
jgi:hypothetical protein